MGYQFSATLAETGKRREVAEEESKLLYKVTNPIRSETSHNVMRCVSRSRFALPPPRYGGVKGAAFQEKGEKKE